MAGKLGINEKIVWVIDQCDNTKILWAGAKIGWADCSIDKE
jgi:hypothetical protein